MTFSGRPDTAATISLRQLLLLEAIGDLRSVRRAAEECGLSQPAVTQSLAKIEDHLGVKLVDRRTSGSYLNESGIKLHRRVKRFLDQAEQAIIELGGTATPAGARAIINRLTRSQLRMLIAAVECGSFEKAPELLGISLASLRRAARDLEANLRVSLFYRTAAGILVSRLGIVFARKMKLALQEVKWGVEELDPIRRGGSRQIVIGAMPFGGSVLLASVLDDFLRKNPGIDVKIVNGATAEIFKALLCGEVDLVIGLLPEATAPDLAFEALVATPYSIVGRTGHPLMSRKAVTVDDLAKYDWIVGTATSSRLACFERLFVQSKTPSTSISTSVLPVIRQLLSASDRLTLMTSYELWHEDRHQLRALSFGPIFPVPSLGITARTNWLPTRPHLDFMDIVRTHVSRSQMSSDMPTSACEEVVTLLHEEVSRLSSRMETSIRPRCYS